MTDAIDDLITRVIQREGGYVNHPNDRGGPTKYGITQATLASWRGHSVTEFQVQTLSVEEAREIYRRRYFNGLEDVTDPKALEFLFDYAVNAGTGAAVRALQKVIGTIPDGAFGPKSKAALVAYGDQSKLFWPLLAARYDHFMRIIGGNHSQAVFATGWANRLLEFWRA